MAFHYRPIDDDRYKTPLAIAIPQRSFGGTACMAGHTNAPLCSVPSFSLIPSFTKQSGKFTPRLHPTIAMFMPEIRKSSHSFGTLLCLKHHKCLRPPSGPAATEYLGALTSSQSFLNQGKHLLDLHLVVCTCRGRMQAMAKAKRLRKPLSCPYIPLNVGIYHQSNIIRSVSDWPNRWYGPGVVANAIDHPLDSSNPRLSDRPMSLP